MKVLVKTFNKSINLREALNLCFIVCVLFVLSIFYASLDNYLISGLFLIVLALFLCVYFFKKSGNIISLAAFFSISWLGGSGLSALKLSYLQTKWCLKTWLVIALIYIFFYLSYSIFSSKRANSEKSFNESIQDPIAKPIATSKEYKESDEHIYAAGLLIALNIVIILSLIAFITEVILLKFVPLFTVGIPHAYSYFHISGLHYFTVSFALVPALIVLYFFHPGKKKNPGIFLRLDLIFCLIVSFLLPILLVSRFELLFTFGLMTFTFLCIDRGRHFKKLSPRLIKLIVLAVFLLVTVYVFITFKRAHSIDYLSGIYEMKYDLPIFFSQPYIYIANNYDNLNLLIRDLREYSHGLKELYPFFALTGLKFLHPEWASFPLYLTREELTTLTLFYDAYYDFGTAGVAVLSFLSGMFAGKIERYVMEATRRNPIILVISAQFMIYLLLSFFTTWFSNPTSWFYLVACLGIYIFINVYVIIIKRLELKKA